MSITYQHCEAILNQVNGGNIKAGPIEFQGQVIEKGMSFRRHLAGTFQRDRLEVVGFAPFDAVILYCSRFEEFEEDRAIHLEEAPEDFAIPAVICKNRREEYEIMKASDFLGYYRTSQEWEAING